MFENLLPSAGSARKKRIRNAIIGGSVVAHGLVAVGLIVAGMWKVEKLETERTTISVAIVTPPGDSGGGGRPKVKLEARKDPVKRVVDEVVQPEKAPKEPVKETQEVAVEDRGNGEGGDDGTAPGNGTGGDGKGLGIPTVGSGCLAPPCGTSTDLPPPELPEVDIPPPEPRDIPPTAAKRISGDPNIAAPDAVKAEMMRARQPSVLGSVKLCIDARGDVESATVVKTTGYPAYDKKLRGEMRTWRYQPYTENGAPTAACFMVHLKYVIKD